MNKLLEQLRSQLRELQTQITTWWSRLTARERRLVSIAGGALGAFLLFVILYSFSSSAGKYESRMELKQEKLTQVQQLAASYREAEQQRQAVERQLSASNVSLISYLEDKGEKSGLDIRSMNPKGDVPIGDGNIIESSVELTLTDVQLDKLVSFLSDVERGPGIVKVKRVRLEPRPQNETLTAWATISTYSLKK